MTLRNLYDAFLSTKCELFTRHEPYYRLSKLGKATWVVLGCKHCYTSSAGKVSNGTSNTNKQLKQA